MRYFSPTLWREVSYPSPHDEIQTAIIEDILLAHYVICFVIMYTSLWIRPFKWAFNIFVWGLFSTCIYLDAAIIFSFSDPLTEENLVRSEYVIYLAYLTCYTGMWVPHTHLNRRPIPKRLTEEEKAHASMLTRFRRNRFFVSRYIIGTGRWHTYIGTDSWHVAVLWRLSIPLLISLAGLISGVGLTPNVLMFGLAVGLAGLATVSLKKEPPTPEEIMDSEASVSEKQALLEKETVMEV